MTIEAFPPVEQADDSGLLAVGGDFEVNSLLLAYRSGVFPWPVFDETPYTWFAPPKRAVLFLNEFHTPKSLFKEWKKNRFNFKIDFNFEAVVNACAKSKTRRSPDGTWIVPEIIRAYTQFHQAGHCHSVECYENDTLVGGLYGVSIGAMFAGESMFFEQANASKLCFYFLVEHLKNRGAEWIDCQQLTPLLKSFGAREISREEFMKILAKAVSKRVELFS